DVNERVRRSQVHREVVREHPSQQVVEHQLSIVFVYWLQAPCGCRYTSTVHARPPEKVWNSSNLHRVTRRPRSSQFREKEKIFRALWTTLDALRRTSIRRPRPTPRERRRSGRARVSCHYSRPEWHLP